MATNEKTAQTQTHGVRMNGSDRPPLKIGELLVKEGFLTDEDVQQALSIQKKEAALRKLPVDQILVKTEALSQSDLEDLLNHSDLKNNNEQPNPLKIGELAVKKKLITEQDLQSAIGVQKASRTLGEILCDLDLVNPLDLDYLLTKYNKQMEIGDLLVSSGLADEKDLRKARQQMSHSSDALEEILVKNKIITREQAQIALSKLHNIPFRKLRGFEYDPEEGDTLRRLVSQVYAEKNLILPISLENNRLTLGLFDPKNIDVVQELRKTYGKLDIFCVLITRERFEKLFAILYDERIMGVKQTRTNQTPSPTKDTNSITLDINEDIEEDETSQYQETDIEAEELVNFMVKYGITNGASDIHVEQDRKGIKLRYRIDGVLRPANIAWLNAKVEEKISGIISRIKVISNLDIAEKRLPQDGVFRTNYYDKTAKKRVDLDFRVATCRAITGENVTIRILDSRKANIGLENLNHSPHVLKPFREILKSSAGMVLVSGPTGSGKSSTLYGALQHIYDPGLKIITAEDPIEYSFPGIMQTQTNSKIDLTFPRLLRSFLRLDPDVILVGEMRDPETAKIGFDAAQTGHLLLSTIHTNDAVSAVSRILDLEVDSGQIASSLTGVLAQRLVRKNCSHCIKEYTPEKEEWRIFFENYPSHLKFYKGQGCEACNFTGYKGRTLFSELFVMNSRLVQAVNEGVDEDTLKKMAIEDGMKTMLDDAFLKLKDTTLAEILRVIPHDTIKNFKSQDAVSSCGFRISDPKTQGSVIDMIRERYETLRGENGDPSDRVDPSLFTDFITNSFSEISNKFGCNEVAFNIENKEGKAVISAIQN